MDDILLKDLVLIGGGHSHAIAIKMLAMSGLRHVQVTLISRDIESPYSGMLPGYIAGYYSKDECYIDLNKLCQFGRVRLVHATVVGLDTVRKVHCTRYTSYMSIVKYLVDCMLYHIRRSGRISYANLYDQSMNHCCEIYSVMYNGINLHRSVVPSSQCVCECLRKSCWEIYTYYSHKNSRLLSIHSLQTCHILYSVNVQTCAFQL